MELTPYVLHDGSWYRDMLTIEASKAVGQYARKYDYQPYEYYENKPYSYPHHNKVPTPSPSSTQFAKELYKPQPKSSPDYFPHSIDYGHSKFIHIPRDLKDQRAIADLEEHRIIQAAKIKENTIHTTPATPFV
eukprot:14350.XXX_84688_80869_1 [CDS] Oithona nana genome sequencing.